MKQHFEKSYSNTLRRTLTSLDNLWESPKQHFEKRYSNTLRRTLMTFIFNSKKGHYKISYADLKSFWKCVCERGLIIDVTL